MRHRLTSFLSLQIHGMFALTSWYHNPDEIHEKIISPEVIRFRPTVCKALGIMIKHARGIVKYISIDLAQGD